MGYCIICTLAALGGYGIGLLMADRIAEHKIQLMRLDAGLDIETGEKYGTDNK